MKTSQYDELETKIQPSRWVGRVIALFTLCGAFALLSQASVIPVATATWVVIGVALGFSIRNVD
jgi:hypothetical protein